MSKMSDEHIKFSVETWDIVTCPQSMWGYHLVENTAFF